ASFRMVSGSLVSGGDDIGDIDIHATDRHAQHTAGGDADFLANLVGEARDVRAALDGDRDVGIDLVAVNGHADLAIVERFAARHLPGVFGFPPFVAGECDNAGDIEHGRFNQLDEDRGSDTDGPANLAAFLDLDRGVDLGL